MSVRKRNPRQQLRTELTLESLERRDLLATVTITGSTLQFLADPGEANDLIITETSGSVTLRDQGASLTPAAPGIVQNGPNEVSVPTAGLDFFTILLGDQDDSLDASAVTPASGLTRLIVGDGDGNDTLVGSDVDDFFTNGLGDDSFDGRGATRSNQLSVVTDNDILLADASFSIGTEVNSYVNFGAVNLTGGAGNSVLDASATTPASGINGLNLNGGPGNDTLIGGNIRNIFRDVDGNNIYQGSPQSGDFIAVFQDSDMLLTDNQFIVGDSVNSISGIERADLTGGTGDNVIDTSGTTLTGSFTSLQIIGGEGDDQLIGGPLDETIRDYGGSNILDGGGGFDLLILDADQDITVTDTDVSFGSDAGTHSNFERLTLSGGAGDNVLDASGVSTGFDFVSIVGRAGNDTLIGSQLTDLIRDVEGNNFIYGNGSPAGKQDNLVLSLDTDMFFSDAVAPGTGTAIVGTSSNTFTGVERITAIGGLASNVMDASGLTSASGTEFVLMQARAGDDILRVSEDMAIDFSLNGEEGFDTLDLTNFSAVPNVITRPGSFDGFLGQVNGIVNFNNVDEFDLPMTNTPPELLDVVTDATLESKAVPGELVTLTGLFNDPDENDPLVAVVDWGDGTTSNATIETQSGTLEATHAYPTGGIFKITVTLGDGTESVTKTTIGVVSGARLAANGELQIIGTDGRDQIHLRRSGSLLKVKWKPESGTTQRFQFADSAVQSVRIVTCEGNDSIHTQHSIDQPMYVDAGAGHDFISTGAGDDFIRAGEGRDWVLAGSGNDIVLGGEGRDWIFGASGRDILIGGGDQDWIFGGSGEDILIGGDLLLTDEEDALNAIRNEWTSNKPITIRKQNLQDGSGDGEGANESAFIDSTTLQGDGAWNFLFGGRDEDWKL